MQFIPLISGIQCKLLWNRTIWYKNNTCRRKIIRVVEENNHRDSVQDFYIGRFMQHVNRIKAESLNILCLFDCRFCGNCQLLYFVILIEWNLHHLNTLRVHQNDVGGLDTRQGRYLSLDWIVLSDVSIPLICSRRKLIKESKLCLWFYVIGFLYFFRPIKMPFPAKRSPWGHTTLMMRLE